MNSDLDVIMTRASIRKYTNQVIEKKTIEVLLNAGFCAPSAQNKKPWEFIVIQDRDKLIRFADYGKYYKMLYEAPLAIIVCGNAEINNNHDYLINDCSAATQNILLAAHACGLGAVWLGVHQDEMKEFYAKELNLPSNIIPVATISIGYPDEVKVQKDRFQKEKVHYEIYEKV